MACEREELCEEFSPEGGEICLNESIMLHVPEGAFNQNTMVTWSFKKEKKCHFPVLDLVARDKATEEEIMMFEKHVRIIYKDVISAPGDLSAPADLCGDPSCIEPDIEYTPRHHAQVPRQQTLGDGDQELNSVFHTFYKTDGRNLTVFTKHFSKFRLLCEKHGKKKAYETYLSADVYQKQEWVENTVNVEVMVVLDVMHNVKSNKNPECWKIKKADKFKYVDTVTLATPSNSQVIEPGSQFECSVSEIDTNMWEYMNTRKEPAYLENVIPCKECQLDVLPDAAVLQFATKTDDKPEFLKAKLDFNIILLKKKQKETFSICNKIGIKIDPQPPSDYIPVHSEYFRNIAVGVERMNLAGYQDQRSPSVAHTSTASTQGGTTSHTDGTPSGEPSATLITVDSEGQALNDYMNQVPVSGRLTDELLLELAKRFTNPMKIKELGNKLNVKSHDVEAILHNEGRDIQGAALTVLKKWFVNQMPDEAFANLWKALCDIGMKKEAKMLETYHPIEAQDV